jgi:hypothetical protein
LHVGDVGVLEETKDLWVVVKWEGLDVVSVLVNGSVWWAEVGRQRRVLVIIPERFRAAVLLESLDKANSVVVVCNSTSVVDVAKDIDQGIPGDFFLISQE